MEAQKRRVGYISLVCVVLLLSVNIFSIQAASPFASLFKRKISETDLTKGEAHRRRDQYLTQEEA